MDYFGSGPLWRIYYLWPFSGWYVMNPTAWEFYSWQNLSAFLALFMWTIIIAYRQRRTPLEMLMLSLDRQLIAKLRPASTANAHLPSAD